MEETGYTLKSFLYGAKYIYNALYKSITDGGQLASTLPEVRRQIAIIEECHNQNPLPRKLEQWL